MYKVAEIFTSINGESRLAGELAVFVRFVGCNLSCTYCDTAWAISMDAPHKEMSLDEIISYVEQTGIKNVTLTGGEPLLSEGIEELIIELIGHNHRVEIETNGAVDIRPLLDTASRLSIKDELSITLDYKCPSSGMEGFMVMENYDVLRSYDTVKFVVGDRADLDKAREIIEKYKLDIQGIEFSVDGEIVLRHDNIEIELGNGDNLAIQMMNLGNILQTVEGKNGILYMKEYDSDNATASFKVR